MQSCWAFSKCSMCVLHCHELAEGTAERESQGCKVEVFELDQGGLGRCGCCWTASVVPWHRHTTCYRSPGFHHFHHIMLPGTFVNMPEYYSGDTKPNCSCIYLRLYLVAPSGDGVTGGCIPNLKSVKLWLCTLHRRCWQLTRMVVGYCCVQLLPPAAAAKAKEVWTLSRMRTWFVVEWLAPCNYG